MTCTGISWLVEGHVIYQYHHGELTLDALSQSVPMLVELLDKLPGDHKVHFINDFLDLTASPPAAKLRNAINPVFQHPRFGWAINIQGKTGGIVAFVTHLFRFRLKLVQSYQEALAVLPLIDPSLATGFTWPETPPREPFTWNY